MNAKKIRYHSTFSRLALSFLVLGMLPLLILSSVYIRNYMDRVEEMAISAEQQTIYSLSGSVNDVIESTDENLIGMYTYTFLDEEYLYEILKDPNLSDNAKRTEINAMLEDISKRCIYVSNLRLRTSGGDLYAYSPKNQSLRSGVGIANELTSIPESEYTKLKVLPAYSAARYYTNTQSTCFTIARNYMDGSSLISNRTKILCTIYADIDTDILSGLVLDRSGQHSNIEVVDLDSMEYVYCADQEKLGKKTEWEEYLQNIGDNENGVIQTGTGYLLYNQIGSTNCCVIDAISRKDIWGSYYAERNYMILALIITLLAMILMYLAYSKRTVKPVQELSRAMEKVQAGDLSVRADIHSGDEIEYLGTGFNHMLEELNDYINKVYLANIQQKETEIRALKMQIQPHYLYNTLDVIRMKALENGDDTTAALLESLSRQLRYLTDQNKKEVLLRDEIGNVREYFQMIRIRYNGLYDLLINVREDTLDLRVPKLILQPLVENALKHGLRTREGSGRIHIFAERKDGKLLLQVMDNGVGMDEDQVKQLNQKLREKTQAVSETGKSIGLKNVEDRIRLLYGEEYHMEVDSKKGMGTIIICTLPAMEPDK